MAWRLIRPKLAEALLWFLAFALCIVPVLIVVIAAFGKPGQYMPTGYAIPKEVTLENFRIAIFEGKLLPAAGTSLVVTFVSVTLIVLLSALAAYPLARSARRWSKVTFGIFVAGLIVPHVGTIPLYVLMRDIGLLGTPWSLIAIYVGGGVPFGILLYTYFLRRLPLEYEEAAVLDGCGPLRLYWHIMLPLMRPIGGTLAVLEVIRVYNDYFTPLLFLTGSPYSTLPLAINQFRDEFTTNYNAIFAALCITIVPVLVLFGFLQKYIVSSISGGLKG